MKNKYVIAVLGIEALFALMFLIIGIVTKEKLFYFYMLMCVGLLWAIYKEEKEE